MLLTSLMEACFLIYLHDSVSRLYQLAKKPPQTGGYLSDIFQWLFEE